MVATTIEQSKKLLELGIDPKTADMFYWCGSSLRIGGYKATDPDFDIPAWSLEALLELFKEKRSYVELVFLPSTYNHEENKWEKNTWRLSDDEYDVWSDNPINACVELIVKLKEKTLL